MGDDPPPIAVIVPVYNGEATLQRTLDSLTAQSFGAWRAVVVDDGSTDNTREVAAAAAAADPRIALISQANAGVSAARNKGLAAVDSPWVLFLDGDDTLDPQGLQRLAEAAKAGVDAVVGRVPLLHSNGKIWLDVMPDVSRSWEVFSAQCAIPIHAALVRREMVTAIGGFDEGLYGAEDWDLWMRAARCGAVFRQIPAPVGYYWNQAGSASKSYRRMAEASLEVTRRAHNPDPRTPMALPAYANGLPEDQLGRHALPALVWLAAGEVARGGDAAWVSELGCPVPSELTDADIRLLAEEMMSGIVRAVATPQDRLAGEWPRLARPMTALLARLFPGDCLAMTRSFLLLALKDKLGVRFGDAPADEAPGLTQVALDLGRPIRVPASGGGLAVQVLSDGQSLGMAMARPGPDGRAPDIAALVLGALDGFSMRRVAEVLKPWRSARFWMAMAAEAARGLPGGKRAAFTRAAASVVRAALASKSGSAF